MQNKATPTASTQRVCRQLKTWRMIALGLFLGIGGPVSADLEMDVDGDGLNDVWQGIHGAWDLTPEGDEDRDGCSNLIESVAGTNPRLSGDCLKVGDTYIAGSSVFFVFDAKVGKKYRILSSGTPGGGYGATGETLQSPDSGTEFVATVDGSKTLKITKPVDSRKFYKLETSDVDSNNDGVSDWVAQKLGYDPNAESVDLDANGKSDFLDLLEGELGGPDMGEPDKVTVVASSVFASEDGPQSGSFVVKRSRSLFEASVAVAFSGTADSTTDYSKSPSVSSVQFTAGEKEKTIFINPNPSQPAAVEGSESVTLTLSNPSSPVVGGAPVIGTPGEATVIISDTTAASGTGLQARYYDTASSTYSNSANFNAGQLKIDRIDPSVNFSWLYGTPNGNTISPNNSPDNYSTVFEGYLSPSAASTSGYRFQLDADDKARLLVDLNRNGVFDLPAEQVIEHGWDSVATVGAFNVSASHMLEVPTGSVVGPTGRYKIRLEHVETTGEARCRLQWSVNGATFANIPQANVFTHTAAMSANYSYTRTVSTAGAMQGTITVTLNGHGLAVGNSVKLAFSSGVLFTPANGNFHGDFTVASVTDSNVFVVNIGAATLPSGTASTGAGFVLNRDTSTTTGWYNLVYANPDFSGAPGRIGINNNGSNDANNGIWGVGTPDVALINPDTFSVRWSGQVQPQFSENYKFIVRADDGVRLKINGQVQALQMLPSAVTSGSTYSYNATTGDLTVSYGSLMAVPNSFAVGETVRLDPTSGNLNHSPATAPTYVYDPATDTVEVDATNLMTQATGTMRTPGSFVVGETVELDPTSGSLSTLSTLPYVISEVNGNKFKFSTGGLTFSPTISINSISVGNPCVISTVTNHGLTTGNQIRISGVSGGTFSSPINDFYVVTVTSPSTFTMTSDCTVAPSAGQGVIIASGNMTISDNRSAVITSATSNSFVVNIGAGKYPHSSTGNVSLELVNRKLKEWIYPGGTAPTPNEQFVEIPMVGGVRYDIELDYFENTSSASCELSWMSHSQPKQIIPAARLYPASDAPPAHLTDTDATALVGGPFSHAILGSNGGNVSISGAPSGLTYSDGVLSGTPTEAGDYQIVITLTRPGGGTSTSVVNLKVASTGGSIVREQWDGITGTSVASIPTGSTPTGTSSLSSLTGPTGGGSNYGARIRGYITAPETGNYYFWIAANDGAELWVSNDAEPVNAFKRAWVNAGSGTPLTYNVEANQKSAWLALEQGMRYYVEILHKAGAGANENLAIGWAKPGQSGTAPSEVVPGYVLSPYVAPTSGSSGGTLYVATLLAQNGSVPEPPKTRVEGVGTATMRLNENETVAYVNFSYSGLTGGNTLTDWHVHCDPYLSNPSAIIFDGVEPVTPGDGLVTSGPYAGSHKWTIEPVGGLSANDIRELIKQGKSYINLHTGLNPGGEIRGNYTPANGSRTFTPPPAPPTWTTDHTTNAGAVRFLTQATFGANVTDIAELKAMASYEAWIDVQVNKPVSLHVPEVLERELYDNNGGGQFDERLVFNAWWRNSVAGQDQLRQRVAFALSEILVVSAQGPLDNRAEALAYYYDILGANAFGNFRTLLEEVTLSPTMGRYLDMKENDKPDISTGRIPNENYAREIKQLFSVGLFRMWPDGTLILNSKDEVVPTYTQREIVGLAHLMTGWDDGYDGAYRTTLGAATNWLRQMREVPGRHYTGPKRLLNNEVLPGLPTLGGVPLDPQATHTSLHFNDPDYQDLPSQELDFIHDQLFNHPNTGPFICRQLIQRLVTSHPSRGYVYRVVQKFNNNGSGVRGDMLAVVKAVLLDYEARSSALVTQPAYGKQREAVLRTTSPARAFRLDGMSGTYVQPDTATSGLGGHVVRVNATNHKLVAGRSVYLEFPVTWTPGATAPTSAPYTVLSTPAPTANTFWVNAKGWAGVSSSDGTTNGGISGTYSQSSGNSSLTVSLSGHWLPASGKAYLDFQNQSGGTMNDGVYTAATSTSTTGGGSTFTITMGDTTARSGRVRMVGFRGSYSAAASGLSTVGQERRITLDTTDWSAGGESVAHHLSVGQSIYLNFTEVSGAATMPTDGEYVVDSVPDPNTFTVLTSTANAPSTTSRNGMWMFPLVTQPVSRSGSVNKLSSTYQLNNTDADIDQAPLNADTVFNFYLPDYKFPGLLASQGITTPEFQTTAETTVVRQSNFFFNGIFNPADTNGISSFRTGQHALVLDFSPWAVDDATNVGLLLGAPVSSSVPWTHNQNIARFIDHMSVLLTADQLSTSAKTLIRNFVSMPITSIGTGNPCTVTTAAAHGYTTGDLVCISGVGTGTISPSLNSNSTARAITVTGSNTFTMTGVNCTVAPTTYTNVHASQVIYNQGSTTPGASERLDRLRSVIHLILSSPDYIIQR